MFIKKYSLKFNSPFLTLIRTIKKFKPSPDEMVLPEFTYAGKKIKPHTRVYVMGLTTHGALGVKSFLKPLKGKKYYTYVHHPHRLEFADQYEVEDVSCGYGFTVFALKASKDIPSPFFGTGIATNCQIGHHIRRKSLEIVIEPSKIDLPLRRISNKKKVACGRAHTLIWTDTEGLWTFGNNSYGQCGRPIVEKEDYSTNATYQHIAMFDGKHIDQIECGQDTSFVLCDGKVFSCGWSADGQTGRGVYHNVESFRAVEGDLKGENVIKVSSKADCVLALTDKGEVFGWGNSEYRQLGGDSEKQQENLPKKLPLDVDDKIIDVAASGTCCFIVTESGDVWSWGFGTLGKGPELQASSKPQLIPSTLLGRNILNKDSKVIKIFTGVSTVAALTNEGGLYAWGRNIGGSLGLGHTKFQHFPLRVCVASTILKVSCGIDHMVILAKSLM